MTEPTDAELDTIDMEAQAVANQNPIGTPFAWRKAYLAAFARAVLAKWGTPPAVAGEPDYATFALWYADHIGDENKPVRDAALATYEAFAPTQPTQAQAGAVPTREFLERTLAAMEGVIDVADRKTEEFDALRSCVIDLTLMLFKPGQHSTTQPVEVPLTDWDMRGQLAASLHCWHRLTPNEAAELVAFFKRIAAHGIKGGQHGSHI